MKKLFLFASFLLFGSFVGCSSSPTSPTNAATNSNSDYLPLTTGSTWTYTGSVGQYTVTIAGDTTFGGFTWKLLTNSAAQGRGSIRKDGSIYRETAPPGYPITGEVIALNETAGSTWAWDISANGSQDHYAFTNAAQGLTRTVLGKNYTDVIDVRMDYTFTFPGLPPQTGTYHYYYAKGIGLIDSDLGAQGEQPLVSYSIK